MLVPGLTPGGNVMAPEDGVAGLDILMKVGWLDLTGEMLVVIWTGDCGKAGVGVGGVAGWVGREGEGMAVLVWVEGAEAGMSYFWTWSR